MGISSSATGLRPGVCTSSTRPTAPYTGQIIYETDTGYLRVWDGAAWDFLSQSLDSWNMPRGLVTTTSGGTNSKGYYTIASQSITVGNTDDLTGSSMTFTGTSGRLYRLHMMCYAGSTSASGWGIIYATDGSNNIKGNAPFTMYNANGTGTAIITYVFTASGSTTLKLRCYSGLGTTSLGTTNSTIVVTIEDIGPSS